MRRSAIAGTALLAIAGPAVADEINNEIQAQNNQVAQQLIVALKTRDDAVISRIDPVIDYGAHGKSNTFVGAHEMVEMFSRCTPGKLADARRFSDTTVLKFTCPGRKVEGKCLTGDLSIMIYRTPVVSLGVVEAQRYGPDCRIAAPPPPPLPEVPK